MIEAEARDLGLEINVPMHQEVVEKGFRLVECGRNPRGLQLLRVRLVEVLPNSVFLGRSFFAAKSHEAIPGKKRIKLAFSVPR